MYPICASKETHVSICATTTVRNDEKDVSEVIPFKICVAFLTGTSNGIENNVGDTGLIRGSSSVFRSLGKLPGG